MIKTTMNDILNSVQIFRNISETPMNIKSAYKIVKVMKAIEKEQEIFLEAQQKLIEKYSKKDKIAIDEQFIDKYNEEMKVFLKTEVELAVEPIEIEDIENIEITPAQVYLIDDFIQKK